MCSPEDLGGGYNSLWSPPSILYVWGSLPPRPLIPTVGQLGSCPASPPAPGVQHCSVTHPKPPGAQEPFAPLHKGQPLEGEGLWGELERPLIGPGPGEVLIPSAPQGTKGPQAKTPPSRLKQRRAWATFPHTCPLPPPALPLHSSPAKTPPPPMALGEFEALFRRFPQKGPPSLATSVCRRRWVLSDKRLGGGGKAEFPWHQLGGRPGSSRPLSRSHHWATPWVPRDL